MIIFVGFGRWTSIGFLSLIEDTLFPFPFFQKVDKYSTNAEKMSWKRRVDVNMAFYIFVLASLTIFYQYYSLQSWPIRPLLQVFACHLQLMMIVGMCLDSGKSLTTQFFRTRIMQFFGRISMALYLVHKNVMKLIKLVTYGPFKWEKGIHEDWDKGICVAKAT